MKHKSKNSEQFEQEIRSVVENGSRSYSDILTDKQIKVLTEWIVSGVTQIEAGEKLGICQTSVHKTLFGNLTYPEKKRYGGVFKKLRKYYTGDYTAGKSGYVRKIK